MATIWDDKMIKSNRINIICAILTFCTILITVLFINGETFGLKSTIANPPYATQLFDESKVHIIDIIMPNFDELLDNALDEEYMICDVVIDGEIVGNVGIRAKGNNSLHLTSKYDSLRYSFKIKFNEYSSGFSYQGLDVLSLNASFQDNTYMKDYMTYDMMRYIGIPSPLCSYVYLTVNGEDLGLYVAVEEIEMSFARRNFGTNHGNLYKPDYMSLNDENSDVALIYTNDEFENYNNIWREAKQKINAADKHRLINALKTLDSGTNLESAVDIDMVMRYMAIQAFTLNFDSYLGRTGHNYYLYEENGRLMMLPWDYNLAYATYALGIKNPINDSTMFVNFPIHTPYYGETMIKRPMFHNLMKHDDYFNLYNAHFDHFISTYFESGYFTNKLQSTVEMIAPYVQEDPTKFCSYDDFLLATDTFELLCLLRAESVREQLSGTIPSTILGQKTDKSAFIDASDVWIPNLGNLSDMQQHNN